MILLLYSLAFSTLVSEDLACVTAGLLVAQGRLSLTSASAACFGGILTGDLLVFLAGRIFGRAALAWQPVARLLDPSRVEKGTEWLQKRGLRVILTSRFIPGLRLPTYFAAGLLGTNFANFAGYFALAAAIWTPLLVAGSAYFGNSLSVVKGSLIWSLAAGPILLVVIRIALQLTQFETRRRWIGYVLRVVRWEFWPFWLAYLPVFPYIAWLAWKHRSLTVCTLANPGIPFGGFTGESKSRILDPLVAAGGPVARFCKIHGCFSGQDRLWAADSFLQSAGMEFPVVAKPDVGERGFGVAIAHSRNDLATYLESATGDLLLQEYVGGIEVGISYVRFPHESHGRITSITEKRFPSVTGDGRRPLKDLILGDARAVCLADVYLARHQDGAGRVPKHGEQVPLIDIGSHCRGALFLDGRRLYTPALEAAIDVASQKLDGFYLGRFDIRAESEEALREGRGFKILEVNGVTGEAAHIYDPSVSLLDAYRALFSHWWNAFAIGAAHRARGIPAPGWRESLQLLHQRGQRQPVFAALPPIALEDRS